MDCYVGEIRLFAFGIIPQDWMPCDGRELPISQFQALYSIVTTKFGSASSPDRFRIPDLRGRVAVGVGTSSEPQPTTYARGQIMGVESVALSAAQVPSHSHPAVATTTPGTQTSPDVTSIPATVVPSVATTAQRFNVYQPPAAAIPNPQKLAPAAISSSGGGGRHDNMQPFLVLNYCICVTGDYPSQS